MYHLTLTEEFTGLTHTQLNSYGKGSNPLDGSGRPPLGIPP
jgi:hypothetical protein